MHFHRGVYRAAHSIIALVTFCANPGQTIEAGEILRVDAQWAEVVAACDLDGVFALLLHFAVTGKDDGWWSQCRIDDTLTVVPLEGHCVQAAAFWRRERDRTDVVH